MKKKILDWLRVNTKFSWPWHFIGGALIYGAVTILFSAWYSLFAVISFSYLTEEWDRIDKSHEDWLPYWKQYGWKDAAWYVAGAVIPFLIEAF